MVRRHRLQNRAGLWLILTSDVILAQPPPSVMSERKDPAHGVIGGLNGKPHVWRPAPQCVGRDTPAL